MKAEIGDYIKFMGFADDDEITPSVPMTSKVIGISDCLDGSEDYDTANGYTINQGALSIDDVLLASEVEIG